MYANWYCPHWQHSAVIQWQQQWYNYGFSMRDISIKVVQRPVLVLSYLHSQSVMLVTRMVTVSLLPWHVTVICRVRSSVVFGMQCLCTTFAGVSCVQCCESHPVFTVLLHFSPSNPVKVSVVVPHLLWTSICLFCTSVSLQPSVTVLTVVTSLALAATTNVNTRTSVHASRGIILSRSTGSRYD